MPVISDGSEASVNNLCIAFHRLREYSVEAGVATIIDGDDILKVSTEHLRDLSFQVGSVYQFIGELLIQPDNEVCSSQDLEEKAHLSVFFCKHTCIMCFVIHIHSHHGQRSL